MLMLEHNSTRELSKIAVCSCGNHHYECHATLKSRLQHVYCMGDSNTTSSIAVSNVIFQNAGKLLVEIWSTEFNSPYIYMVVVLLENSVQKYWGPGSHIYRLAFHLHECVAGHLIVVLDADRCVGMVLHCVGCPMHFRMWNVVVHPSHWDNKKWKH